MCRDAYFEGADAMTRLKIPSASEELHAIEAEIKALPPGTEFEFFVSRKGTFVRGGKYGTTWIRWTPAKATKQ
jgi:hypothetical protein